VLPIPLETTPQPNIRIRKRDRDRAERIGLAGGPKPTLRERAVRLALEKGEVRTKDLTEIGVPRCYLARICEEGLLVRWVRPLSCGRSQSGLMARYEWLLNAQDADANRSRIRYAGVEKAELVLWNGQVAPEKADARDRTVSSSLPLRS
jgi:hypothetical protein